MQTGIALRHSDMARTMIKKSSRLGLSQRSSSCFSDNSDTHHIETYFSGWIHSRGLDSYADSPYHDSNGIKRCRNFLVLNVGFKPENIGRKKFVGFDQWSFSHSVLSESKDSELENISYTHLILTKNLFLPVKIFNQDQSEIIQFFRFSADCTSSPVKMC